MRGRIPLNEKSVVCSKTDSYTVVHFLSEAGGSSLTYYAARNSDGQLTVLKELYPKELSGNLKRDGQVLCRTELTQRQQRRWAQYAELFTREGMCSRRLQSSAAQQLVGSGDAVLAPEYAFFSSDPFQANGTWYIAVCTGNGETISGSKRTLPQIFEVMTAVCTAIGGLHKSGFVHLDIKPDNLFVLPAGQVKLLDFGSIQECGAVDERMLSYSEGFSAPELFTDGAVCGVRADVYSAAAVFFYMLFGNSVSRQSRLDSVCFDFQVMTDEVLGCLSGCSCSMLEAVFSLLRKNLSDDPQDRVENMEVLCAEFAALSEKYRQDTKSDQDGILDPDALVERLRELCALMNTFPLCTDAAKRYAAGLRQSAEVSMEANGAFKACIDALHRLLYIKGEYEKSLFCLLFIQENTDIDRRRASDRRKFYEFIVDCCDKLGQNELREHYIKKAESIRLSRSEREPHRFEETLRISNMHEHRFDFENMLRVSNEFIQEMWSEEEEDAVSAVCMQQEIDRDLVRQAGRLAEALCLRQPEGWQKDARAIMTHIADNLTDSEGSFRDRSVDNLLHFSIESRDAALFERALGQLSKDHPLARGEASSLERWIEASAGRFAGRQEDIDGYALYLFFKAVNALFFEDMDDAAADALCAMLKERMYDQVSVWHPQSLIYAHAAILSGRLTERNGLRIQVHESFRKKLEETIKQMYRQERGIVRIIAQAAYLAVCLHMENVRAQYAAHMLLERDILMGIEDGSFSPEYFEDVLGSKDSRALLAKFRFKHA